MLAVSKSSISVLLCIALLGVVAVQSKEWKSGEIVSRDAFKFGAFEARMKAAQGSGGISGFLVIVPDAGATRPWQELAFEFFGKSAGDRYQTQIIIPGKPEDDPTAHSPRSQNMVETTSPVNFFDNFVTVRMEWTPKALSFYLDGTLVRQETDANKYSQLMDPSKTEPMNIRTSLWAGFSDWSGQVDPSNPPTSVTVDYIKYESYDSGSGKFTDEWKDDFNTFDSSRWEKATWTFPYAVNDFSPDNVVTKDGNLVINFSR